ncbi:hypothetical protein BHE74_00050267, partial [Ensete ventricosum]
EVPKRLWIDSDTVVASEIGRLCAGLKPWVSIALFLLRERALGKASPWHPYLDILPPTTNSTIFWTEEELSEIEDTDSYVGKDGCRSEQSVCINTSSLPTHAYHDKYTQVYIQYDIAKSNADLALDYGFVEQRPDRDSYTFTLEISESDPFYGDKLDIAESNGLDETAYFDIALGCPLPPLMLPYLRLVALGGTDAFLLESVFRNTIWGHLELPVSRANEEAICRVVRQACKSALSAYRTTVEEKKACRCNAQDEKLMEGDNLDERLRIAVCIRAGEKKVLQQIEGAFRERESELDVLEYYQERRLKDLGLVGEQGEIIFWESK